MFSLHNEGNELEKNLSLSTLLNGINNGDQNHWLNLILEASGANDQVEMLLNENKTVKFFLFIIKKF